jgi:hypothetical protein
MEPEMIRELAGHQLVPPEKNFRWRGGEITRLEGFTDAVFAFAVTLLVVSLEVPHTYDELVVAMFISGANMTLPKKMFDSIMSEIEPTVAAVSAMQIVLISALLLLGTWLRRPVTAPLMH